MKEVILHVRDVDAFFADAGAMARRLDRGQTRGAFARFAFESMEGPPKVLTANRWLRITAETALDAQPEAARRRAQTPAACVFSIRNTIRRSVCSTISSRSPVSRMRLGMSIAASGSVQ